MRHSIWLTALVLGLNVSCPLVGCSSDTADSENVAQGSVRLPLTAANSAGVLYRLTAATFSISNANGTGTVVSSDTDPSATVMSTTVRNGDYTVALDPGWVLQDAATNTAVNASLLSASTQALTVTANAVSTVIYRFSVNGQVVTTFDGTINIGIEISNCGDGIIQDNEECDDGNNNNGDGCLNTCLLGVCGDGVVRTMAIDLNDDGDTNDTGEAAESCDDANNNDNDNCTSFCTIPTCGDGAVQAGEECDDANNNDNDGCTTSCYLPTCGDGIVQTMAIDLNGDGDTYDTGEAAESCDDANNNDNDNCTSFCTIPTCGDGVVQAGEECDDANNNDNDGCTTSCATT